jgi:hypothetical protein
MHWSRVYAASSALYALAAGYRDLFLTADP